MAKQTLAQFKKSMGMTPRRFLIRRVAHVFVDRLWLHRASLHLWNVYRLGEKTPDYVIKDELRTQAQHRGKDTLGYLVWEYHQNLTPEQLDYLVQSIRSEIGKGLRRKHKQEQMRKKKQ